MRVIGLTGPSGAGKGVCSEYLISCGIPCIDADAVYHGLIDTPSPCTKELAEVFGVDILNARGGVDRQALAALVFSDESHTLTEQLNQTTHKYVRMEILRLLGEFQEGGISAVAVDAPLLFEASFDEMCDFCIAVIAPYETRLARIMTRDLLPRERAVARLTAQKADEYYTSRSKYTVFNDFDKEKTQKQLKAILTAEGLID